MRRNLTVAIWFTALTLSFAIGFQNCARIEFGTDLESLRGKLNTGGSLLINNDEPTTRSADVQLSLEHEAADEMFLTEDPTCAAGGQWQSFSKVLPWTLNKKNDEARVFVKFRKAASPDVESECFHDEILHDDIAPVLTLTREPNSFINQSSATIEFTAQDGGSGVESVTCQSADGKNVDCQDRHEVSGLTEGPQSIRIVARDRAGNDAAPKESSFVVDLTPPQITINQGPSRVTNELRSEFRFSATDALAGIASYECRYDGAPAFEACTSPVARDLAEGPRTLAVRAIDRAGNRSADLSYAWTIDRTAPTVRFTRAPGAFSNQNRGIFEFTGTDQGQAISRFECSLNGGAFASCTSPHTTAVLAAGRQTFAVRGYDDAGNVSQPATVSWVIDLTSPAVTISSTPTAITNRTDARFAFTATDSESGVERTECQIDNNGYAPCDQVREYANLAQGTRRFDVRAVDRAGNVSQPSSFQWQIDVTRPVVEILTGPTAMTRERDAQFTFQASDVGSGVARIECKLDNEAAYATCTSPRAYTNLPERLTIFSTRAIDRAGNISDVRNHQWLIDVTAPAINIGRQPVSVIGVADTAEIQFTVTDSGSGVERVQCGLGNSLMNCSEMYTTQLRNLQPGDYRFNIIATDKLGNESRREIAFKVELRTIDITQDVNVQRNNRVDVLVVIDNSGSMATEQQNMAMRFATFIDQLRGFDWQIAIVTTDVSSNAALRDGRLVRLTTSTNSDLFILNSAMDPAMAKQIFAASIQRPERGSGNEQGIAATYRAIQRSQSTLAGDVPNRQFFRADAALAAIVVTDADETNPAGTQPQNQPETLVNLVRTTWGQQKKFAFHSIIVKPNDQACLRVNGNEAYGVTYASLSQLTGGVIGSVCEADYGSQLANIGVSTVELVRSANLTCMPLDTNGDSKPDVQITTSDMSAAPGYVTEGMRITFDRSLPAGVNRLRYQCLRPAGT